MNQVELQRVTSIDSTQGEEILIGWLFSCLQIVTSFGIDFQPKSLTIALAFSEAVLSLLPSARLSSFRRTIHSDASHPVNTARSKRDSRKSMLSATAFPLITCQLNVNLAHRIRIERDFMLGWCCNRDIPLAALDGVPFVCGTPQPQRPA